MNKAWLRWLLLLAAVLATVLTTSAAGAATADAGPGAVRPVAGPTGPHDGYLTLRDGRVFAFGGQEEVFDPASGAWARVASPVDVTDAVYVELRGGRVLELGGQSRASYDAPLVTLDRVGVWDPGTGRWSEGPRLPAARFGGSAVRRTDGSVVLAGSDRAAHYVFDQIVTDDRVLALDADATTWTPLPAPLGGVDTLLRLAALPDGAVLLVREGTGSDPELWPEVLRNGRWQRTPPPTVHSWLPSHQYQQPTAVSLPSGEVAAFATGGNTAVGPQLYDPATGRWRELGLRSELASTVVSDPTGTLLASAAPGSARRVLSYDLERDLWRTAGTLPSGYARLVVAAGTGDVLVAGSAGWGLWTPPRTTVEPLRSSRAARLTAVHETSLGTGDQTDPVFARLQSVSGQEMLVGEPVELWQQNGAGDWSLLERRFTGAGGTVRFRPVLSTTARRALRHPVTAVAGQAGAVLEPPATAQLRPRPVASLTVSEEPGQVTAWWTPPEDNGGPAVAGYVVNGRQYPATTDHVSMAVQPGRTWEFRVQPTMPDGSTGEDRRLSGVATGGPARLDLPSGTPVCGAVEPGTVWRASGSPYVICAAGVVVPPGSDLDIDASGGAVRVVATDRNGIRLHGGTLRTVGTAADRRVLFEGPDDARGSWYGLSGDLGSALSLTDSTIRGASISLRDSALLRLQRVEVSGSAFAGVVADGTPLDAVDVEVRESAKGVSAECDEACGSVSLQRVRVVAVDGQGVVITDAHEPVVRDLVVTDSGNASPRQPAVQLDRVRVASGPGGIEGLTGARNGLDAVVLDGFVTRDLTLSTPTPHSAVAPLGHLLGRSVQVVDGATVTVASGAVLKAVDAQCSSGGCPRTLWAGRGSTVRALPGALLTTARDPAGPSTCPSAVAADCTTTRDSWQGLGAAGPGSAVDLDGADVRWAATAVGAEDGRAQVAGGSITDSGTAVEGSGQRLLRGVRVERVDQGVVDESPMPTVTSSLTLEQVRIADVRRDALRSTSTPQVRLDGVEVDGAGSGVELVGADLPVVRHVVVRRTGRAADGELPQPAVRLRSTRMTFGPGGVEDISGSGNGFDAIALAGRLVSDLQWRPLVDSAADAPLGMYLWPADSPTRDGLQVAAGATLTVPAGAVVRAAGLETSEPALELDDGTLDASAGGAVFASLADTAVPGPVLCLQAGYPRCAPGARWSGISATQQGGGARVVLRDSDVRAAHLLLRQGDPARSSLDARGSRFGGSVGAVAARVDLLDCDLGGASVQASTLHVERNTFHGSIWANGSLDPDGPGDDVTFRDNTVLGDGAVTYGSYSGVMRLTSAVVSIGPGGEVDGNRIGNTGVDVLVLDGVVAQGGLVWRSPENSPTPALAGFVVGAGGLQVRDGPATFPADSVVRLAGRLDLQGVPLDLSAGGVTVTGLQGTSLQLGGGTAELRTSERTGTPRPWTRIADAAVEVPLRLVAADASPSDARAGVVAVDSRLRGISVDGGRTRLRDSSVDRIEVRDGRLDVDAVTSSGGLQLHASAATVDGLVVTGTRPLDNAFLGSGESAIDLWRGSSGTFRCIDLHDNRGGIGNHSGGSVVVEDSNLTGNLVAGAYYPRFDVDAGTDLTTRRVWWGQPGGPVRGQLRQGPGVVRDLEPRDAPAPCADPAAPALPPLTATAPRVLPVAGVDVAFSRDVSATSAASIALSATDGRPALAVSVTCAGPVGSFASCAQLTAVRRVHLVPASKPGPNRRFTVALSRVRGLDDGAPVTGGVALVTPGTDKDFDGDGRADLTVYRPSTSTWYVAGRSAVRYGSKGDVAVPADYDGDGRADMAVFRPSNGTWYVRGGATTTWGRTGDVPVPRDYDGDGRADLAVYRPSNGTWYVKGQAATVYGVQKGDQPVPGDYDADGRTDIAVYRPSNGTWYVKGQSTTRFGASADRPAPRDHDGDGRTDLAVWRPSNATWYLRGAGTVRQGSSGDMPL